MDRGRCLNILRDAGVGLKTIRILRAFWNKAELACRASGYYGRIFKEWKGVTQGGILSPTIFNLMVTVILREWMRQLEEKGVDREDICQIAVCFYADDGLTAARDSSTLQKAIDTLVTIFERVGLKTNTEKKEAMTSVLSRIWVPLSEEAYG